MRAGELRHSVIIQERSTTQNSFGEEPDTWADVATVRAAIKPIQGKEFVAAKQAQSETTHKVIMRYWPGLTAKHRLKFGSRILEIEMIRNIDERNHMYELRCVELDG
jgi:SPP1 family predicted phage head-tail adaptor